MSWTVLALVLAALLGVLLVAGQWIPIALGVAGMIVIVLGRGVDSLPLLSSIVWNTVDNYILIAVPLFLLMGELILRSGLNTKFYQGVALILGRLPGVLLHTNIVSCGLFSAVCGSSIATAASIGTVAIPELTRRRYEPRIVLGSLAAGGTLGVLIPPSITMILYGALVEESVVALFLAGVVPGLLLSALFMIYIAIRVWSDPQLAPPRERGSVTLGERLRGAVHLLPVVALMTAVLGGIYSGITTPTEAAAVGAVGAFVLGLTFGTLGRQEFEEALFATVRTTCMVIFIVVAAQILSAALSYGGVTRGLAGWIVSWGLSRWMLFAALVVFYLLLGCIVDGLSMMFITLPVLYPVVQQAGFDPIWFGVALTLLIEMAMITPPIGLNLFVIQGIADGRTLGDVAIGAAPFTVLMLLMLVLLAMFPSLALWLPSQLAAG